MSFVSAVPEFMTAAATDLDNILLSLGKANAAAAEDTTTLLAAGADEVSQAVVTLFNQWGKDYQGLSAQASGFQAEFAAALTAAGNAYAQGEAQIADMLGLSGPATAGPALASVARAAEPTVDAILLMAGSGVSTPPLDAMLKAYNLFAPNYRTLPDTVLTAVSTAEGFYPLTGVKDLTPDISEARGLIQLDNAITAVLGLAPTGKTVLIGGLSQSAVIASMEMPRLLSNGYTSSNAHFILIGDPSNPSGGLFTRFPNFSIPSLGATFGVATPSNDFPTTIWTGEYDGMADFPRYPINFLADLNALLGFPYVHGHYLDLTPADVASAYTLSQSGAPTQTTYNIIPTKDLPLLRPLRAIPLIGNPLADLLQPDLRALVNWGYGDPHFGWSTTPADIPTPFGFLPPPSATAALGPLLVSGTQQGIGAFITDLSNLPPAAPTHLALPALTLSSPAPTPSTLIDIISAVQSANTNVVNTLTTAGTTAYATLLPTADIATALLVTLPSYDVNVFLDGIKDALKGNVIQGLMDAFGDPIAADVGLGTFAGGFEFLTLEEAFSTIFSGEPHPGSI